MHKQFLRPQAIQGQWCWIILLPCVNLLPRAKQSTEGDFRQGPAQFSEPVLTVGGFSLTLLGDCDVWLAAYIIM